MINNKKSSLLADLRQTLGVNNVITSISKQQIYVRGMVKDEVVPEIMAVIIPQSLIALWHAINLCAAADVIIIAQAANTGLTGGSTPFGEYDRAVIVISMQSLHGVHLLNEGTEVIALPAATLQQLDALLAPIDREPHSVLGSSCVGASVIGGICNSSGGMLVQRGPAYTELSLFARRQASGEFELINHLGLDLGDTPEEILSRLEAGDFEKNVGITADKANGVTCNVNRNVDNDKRIKANANYHYQDKVRDCDSSTPARFNNDPNGLFEASGSAGKLIVFAVRVATFVKPKLEQTFFISTNDADVLTHLRQKWLKSELTLPIFAEYMHRDYSEITLRYGRDTCLSMSRLPANKIATLYRLQTKMGYWLDKWHLPKSLSDRLLQLASSFMPTSLPKTLLKQAQSYRYHLIIKVADDDIEPAQRFLQAHLANSAKHNLQDQNLQSLQNPQSLQGSQNSNSLLHICSANEGAALLIFRSAATAAMYRYYHLQQQQFGELLATDIALPRSATDWDEKLPEHLQSQVEQSFYLGHFFCHVMHQDYLLKPNIDLHKFKTELLAFYDQRDIEYPAEHNVGHIYQAKSELNNFYKDLDPTNSLNPGVGRTTKGKHWRLAPIKEEAHDCPYE